MDILVEVVGIFLVALTGAWMIFETGDLTKRFVVKEKLRHIRDKLGSLGRASDPRERIRLSREINDLLGDIEKVHNL